MSTLLLLVIYIAFISLGLPDSVLGTAWPMMHLDIGAPLSVAGIVNVIVSFGTVTSSLSSQRLIRRFGTFAVSAFSIILTFTALFLVSGSSSFLSLVLFSIPLGLGGGAIDTVLNNFVAMHYSAMQMNFLHAFWGVGTIIAPSILSVFFESGRSWREAYIILAIIQCVIFFIFLISKPLWKTKEKPDTDKKDELLRQERKVYSNAQLIRMRGVFPSCIGFAFYAFEGVTILWLASYLVYGKGLDAASAAALSSMTYLGITSGRIATAFIADKVRSSHMILCAQILILLSLIALIFSDSVAMLYGVIFILGFSFGPIYPAMVRQTVSYFRPEYSVGIIGLQMSFAYVGSMVLPPLYGLLSSTFSQSIFPYYLIILLAVQSAGTTLKTVLCQKNV